MMNPLIKRLPREFRSDFGKYAVIFLFMIMLISIVSGFLVSDSSMIAAYNEGFEKYNVENGHITFDKEPDASILSDIAEKADLTFYDLRYFEEDSDSEGKTSRVYILRDKVNRECLLEGEFPAAENEIAIDRVFAANNKIKVGDTLTLNGKELNICGFVALSDYSCLYEKNTDMMLDSLNFNVGVMTADGFDYVDSSRIFYNYAWKYNCEYDRNDLVRAAEMSDKVLDALKDVVTEYDEDIIEAQVTELKNKLEKAGKEYAELYMTTGKEPAKSDLSVELDSFLFGIVKDSVNAQIKGETYEMPDESEFENELDKTQIIGIKDYVPQHLNMAINFAGDDMGKDKGFVIVFNYIVIVILAFIFAVTTSNTIAAESGVIGTLRASGYSRGELIRHYLILPVLITLIASVIGNILGYTCFTDIMANMYYMSYSLGTFTVLWNAEAFILTTLIPIILMLVINFGIIYGKMRLSPLKFLRRELKKKSGKKAFRLNTKIPFKTRFKIRIIFQNLPNYIVMFFGIILGALVIIFGDMFSSLFDNYIDIVMDSLICDYQYVLTDTIETENENAEKFCMTSYKFTYEDFVTDDISIYGIDENSRYVFAETENDSVAVSSTIQAKYGLGTGDEIVLSDPYSKDKTYTFKIDSVYDFDASLTIFISREKFNEMFGNEPDYFNGYFSNERLDDIDEDSVALIMTSKDYTKIADQLKISVGDLMGYFAIFGTLMFILIMYILSKQVIERNFQSISMCKILGFRNGEIGSLYIISTSIAVILGIVIAIPLTDYTVDLIFSKYLYKMLAGYFPCSIDPMCYVRMALIGIASYAFVSVLQLMKIKKIPKSEALKNVE